MADNPPPPLVLELDWEGELRFKSRTNGATVHLDAAAKTGPTPVQALAYGLAGCMAIDVVNILTRARTPPRSLQARLSGEQAGTSPKRFTAFQLHFRLEGDVPPDRVERAIQLSRDTYCSVWHSLRQDITFETSFEVVA
jgi:putative redox protein